MENSYQQIIHASSCSEANTEAEQTAHSSLYADTGTDLCRSPLFSQAVSQHEYQPLPRQFFNKNSAQPRVESSSMHFNPLHSHQEQVHRFFQPSQQPPFTTIQGQLQIENKPSAVDLHQLLGINNQSHHVHETTYNTGQTWTHFFPPNDVSGQQRPLEMLRRLHAEVPSVDSTCSAGNVHSDDWMSQAYAELQSVREMYLSDLSSIYKRACYAYLQPSSTGQASKFEYTKGCIERMVQLLNTPRSEIVRFNKDKFYFSLFMLIKNVEKYKSNRGSVSTQPYAQSLSQLPLLRQWLDSKMLSQAANPGSRGNAGSSQFQVQEGSLNSNLGNIELDHTMPVAGSIFSSTQIGSSDLSPLPTLKQTNFYPRTVPPNSGTSSPQLNRQNKKQMRHPQALNQQANQSSAEKKHQMLIQRVKEINEKQQYEYSPRSLFPSPCLKIPWRETPLVSSGHMYPKQLSFPLRKASPSKSVTSPLVVASPSSPALPSSSPICLEKLFSIEVQDSTDHPQTPIVQLAEDPQLLLGESSGHPQSFVGVTLASIQNQLVALGTSEKSASLSPVDPNFLKENQITSTNELSTKCLFEMVKSMSPIALISSVQDITSVITLMDTLSGKIVTSGYLKITCKDLAADRVHCLEKMTSTLLCKGAASNMMKRQTRISASCLSSSCYGNNSDGCLSGNPSNSELCETSSNKRRKTRVGFDGWFPNYRVSGFLTGLSFQLNDAIIEEIKQINQSLIETVVNVASGFNDDIDAVVRCSYSAVGLGHNRKQRNTSNMKMPILLVELLLPEDYPKSSPRVLNASSPSCSEAGKFEDLSGRAKLMFILSLHKLSEPFTLRDMAEAWDYSARSVLLEFAQSCGGGSFSSKYGSWESCTTAV